MKRFFDVILSTALLLALALPLAVAAVLIRLESEGPAIFKQQRVGRHRRSFMCLKLRSMAQNTAQVPTHEAQPASVTRIGRLLRRSKLDEAPQLINVLKGEMSLVGPRPCLPSQTELIRLRDALGVYEVLPGITGLAQVQGIDMSDPKKLAEIDAQYCAAPSLWQDLRLLGATFSQRALADRTKV